MRQKQGVFSLFLLSPSSRRAWIEIQILQGEKDREKSPSSRRAWIEIIRHRPFPLWIPVALLAEGVDRNKYKYDRHSRAIRSPSSRRAWIEIAG